MLTAIPIVARISTQTLTVFEILTFKMPDLAKLNQGRAVQNSQLRHSIENTRLPILLAILMSAPSRTNYEKFDIENVGQGQGGERKHETCTVRLEMFDSI